MNQIIAVVHFEGDINQPETITPTTIEPILSIDRATFIHQWNEGVAAVQKWEQLCENFYQILLKSGIVDENGLHIEEYTPGSVCRFLLANKAMFPQLFADSPVGMMVMQAIKAGAKTMKKGKDIEVNWEEISAHAGPMTEAILNQMLKSQVRADMLQPIYEKFFSTAVNKSVSPTDN